MVYKKIKYIVLLLVLALTIPTFCYALDTDSIYVWSNNTSIETSVSPSTEERKLFRYYIWKCHFNGSENWSNSL